MAEKSSWRSGYVVVFVLFIALLVAYLDRVNVAVLIADPIFLKDMGIADRPDLRGLLMSVFLWIYGAAALFLSFPLDKIGARKGLVFMSAVWALSMFLAGAAWSFGIILLSRVILGIGEGVQVPLNSMVVKNWAPPRERGMANSIWGTGVFVGAAITMPIIAGLIATTGWRITMFIMGLIPLLIVVPLVLIFIYNHPGESRWISRKELDYINEGLMKEKAKLNKEVLGKSVEHKAGLRDILTNTDYWISLLAWVFLTWMFWGLLSWLPSYLKTACGFTWAEMGFWSSLPYAVGTISLVISGYLMLRIRHSSIFLWTGPLVYAISMVLAITSDNNLLTALWMSAAMGGLCWAFAASFVVLQKIVPSEIIARSTGLWTGVAQISAGFVPYVIGWLILVNKGSYNAGFTFLITISLLCSLSSFVLYLREGRTFGKIIEPASTGVELSETR